jgi:hypothetical protein
MDEFRAYRQRIQNAKEDAELEAGFKKALEEEAIKKLQELPGKEVVVEIPQGAFDDYIAAMVNEEKYIPAPNRVLVKPPDGKEYFEVAAPEEAVEYALAASKYKDKNEEPIHDITPDEFFYEWQRYPDESLTYYKGDEVLCDSEGKPIEEGYAGIVGNCLDRFGVLSEDPNMVFVVNHRKQIKYEVAKEPSAFYGESMEEALASTDIPDKDSEVEEKTDKYGRVIK